MIAAVAMLVTHIDVNIPPRIMPKTSLRGEPPEKRRM